MSQYLKHFVFVAALFMNANVMASGLQGYASSVAGAKAVTHKTAKIHPVTDITVVNASTSGIYAVVPNSPIYDFVAAGFHHHIYNNDPNIYWTYIELRDSYQQTFYTATVCPLAIISVMGYTGNYRVNLDDDLCH